MDNDSQALFEQRNVANDLIVGFVHGCCVKAQDITMVRVNHFGLFPHLIGKPCKIYVSCGKGISARIASRKEEQLFHELMHVLTFGF